MKKIKFLKNITFFEILINTICAVLFFGGILTKVMDLSNHILWGVGIFHVTSMILHWLAWNQLPTTHTHRIIFNLWVVSSFALTIIASFISTQALMTMCILLAIFAGIWFVFYLLILLKEFKYLKHKRDLYEKRELIHF